MLFLKISPLLIALAMSVSTVSLKMSTEHTAVDVGLKHAMISMHQAMAQVSFTGNTDVDFAAMMIPHHAGAIEMAKAELKYGTDIRLRRLAQEIIVTQQSEIAVMQLALKHPKS